MHSPFIHRITIRNFKSIAACQTTSVDGMKQRRILASGRGKVRLLKPGELPNNWDSATDPRLTVWEMIHHLIRVLEASGEAQRRSWWPSSGPRPRLLQICPIGSTPSANERSARRRRAVVKRSRPELALASPAKLEGGQTQQ
jgi:hypothetical protein